MNNDDELTMIESLLDKWDCKAMQDHLEYITFKRSWRNFFVKIYVIRCFKCNLDIRTEF